MNGKFAKTERPKQHICVFQVSALKKKKLGMAGRHNSFFLVKIFYFILKLHFLHFPHFSANLTTFAHNSQ